MIREMIWEYQSVKLDRGESWYDALRLNGERGWEAWHMESINGFREIYFKRPFTEGK